MRSDLAGIKFAAKGFALCWLLAGMSQAEAAELSAFLTGNMLGSVVDSAGSPQIGATVQLLNRYQRTLAKATTGRDGKFAFAGLPFDIYSLRVTQPSFFPAVRDRIVVKAGADSILQIHMATLFSSVQVNYKLPGGTMSEDWKWVLRTSTATRPVTRYLPTLAPETQNAQAAEKRVGAKSQVFSDTHALFRVNHSGGGMLDTDSASSDLGSVFALSTNMFGRNQVQIAGSYGQASDFTPMAKGVAAVYQYDSRNVFAGTPEVTLTMSQFNRFSNPFSGSQMPSLRMMSLSIYQTAEPLENVHLEYGANGTSVDYIQHSATISPFARMTVALGATDQIMAAYSSGGRPDELIAHGERQGMESAFVTSDLANAVAALSRLPQISSREGQLRLQRTQNYELGYGHVSQGRTYAVSGFYEHVANGRLSLAGNFGGVNPENLLFDGVSKTSTYNVGGYSRFGYSGSMTQKVNEYVDLGLSYGRMGGFIANFGGFSGIQNAPLRMSTGNVAGADLRARIPASGTRIDAGYGWVSTGLAVPAHIFTTQANLMTPGLNFQLKQPIPTLFGFPGRLELTADLRNLLAQGYIPVGSGPGGQLLIVQSPRAIRGGLAFTF